MFWQILLFDSCCQDIMKHWMLFQKMGLKWTPSAGSDISNWLLTMSSPKRETRGNGFSEPAVTRNKRRNSLEAAASQPRLLLRESHTATPAFKCEPSPFRSLSPPLSPPQYDLSFVKLPQLVSKVCPELPLRETVWQEGPRFVTPVKAIQHSNDRRFK